LRIVLFLFLFFFFVFEGFLLAKISKDHRFVSLIVWKVEQWSNNFEGMIVLFVPIRPTMCKTAMVMAYFKNVICQKIKQNVSEKQPKHFKISNDNDQHKSDTLANQSHILTFLFLLLLGIFCMLSSGRWPLFLRHGAFQWCN
jgi:hypothetical protein